MILLKLGGSIITNKSRPLTPRIDITDTLVKNLKKIDESIILVHGGGSFGHYWSVKFDMHTKPKKYSLRGTALVKNSMVELNRIILNILQKNKLDPYCMPPVSFMGGDRPITKKIREVGEIAEAGMIPVTYGDAIYYGQKKTYILSGDKIMTHVAKILRPRLCIFALNEDGIYNNMKSRELVEEFVNKKPVMEKNKMDVTGGMIRKTEEAIKIANMGMNVFFVNGAKPERVIKAVKKDIFDGTIFRGK